MNHTHESLRFKFRTLSIVVAPSVIFLVGSWLACSTAFAMSENPFQPNLFIMFGGTAVVVAVALLVAIFLVNRTNVPASDSGIPPSPEP